MLADRCNGDKSDHLAAPAHLYRWFDRFNVQAGELADLAGNTRWMSDPARSGALVRSTYLHVAPRTPLWVVGREFVDAEGPIRLSV